MEVFGKLLDETPDGTLPTQFALIGTAELFPIFQHLSIHLGEFPKEDAASLAKAYTIARGF